MVEKKNCRQLFPDNLVHELDPIVDREQLELPSFETASPRVTMAERVVIDLCNRWLKASASWEVETKATANMELEALAALLICSDYASKFTKTARTKLEHLVNSSENKVPWYHLLPWQLCEDLSIGGLPMMTSGFPVLIANLDHQNSSIREWMQELAWVVRRHLQSEFAAPRLLNTVACCLIGVDEAWGLAANLFRNEPTFLRFADSWIPSDPMFCEQYSNRKEEYRLMPVEGFQSRFIEVECQARRIIDSLALE